MKCVMLKGKNVTNKPTNSLNNNEFNKCVHRTIKPTSYKPKPLTKGNLYKSLHELIVESNESEDDAFVAEDEVDNNNSTLLVNSATVSKANPRDIMESLSIPSKGNSTPSSTKKIFNKSEINVNGKIY